MVEAAVESYTFTSDVHNLLTILVHSVYSSKEVCIRELISNASDALDKIRYKSLTDSELLGEDNELEIKVIPNEEEKTITIKDNGIGMTKSEMVNFLGKIAKSGTRSFAQALEKSADQSNLIGQFGIGFYSAFLIADKVTVISKSPFDDQTHMWESDASTSYTIQALDNYDLNRGTEVILHVKEGNHEFLKDSKLESVIMHHSAYVIYPIKLACNKTKEVDDEDAIEEEAKSTEEPKLDENGNVIEPKTDENGNLEEVKKDDETEKKSKPKKTVHYVEDKWLNNEPRIWEKDPDSITEEEYTKTYKTLTKSWEAPFMSKVYEAEGVCSFKLLIFIHKRQKNEVFESRSESGSAHAKLFSKGVFLCDFNKQNPFFENSFQSFCYVAIDVEDLPQQVSRENIVSKKLLQLFKKHAKNKIHAMLKEIKNDSEKYKEILKNHADGFKLGAFEDSLRGDDFLSLIQWDHSLDEEKILLEDYAKKAKELNQEQIYFITGKDVDVLRKNKTVQKLKDMGRDVILSITPLDEFIFNKKQSYDGLKYQDITKEGFILSGDEESKAKREKYEEEYKEFCTKAKGILSGIVSDVKVKDNFVGPYCIQVPNHAMSSQMENLHKSQPLGGNQMAFFNQSMKVFAINPDHKEVAWMKEKVMAGEQIGSEVLKICAQVAMIGQGYALDKPEQFCDQITKMLSWAMGDDAPNSDAAAPIKVPEEGSTALDEVD